MTPAFDPWEAEQIRRRASDRYQDTPEQIAARQSDAASVVPVPPAADYIPRSIR